MPVIARGKKSCAHVYEGACRKSGDDAKQQTDAGVGPAIVSPILPSATRISKEFNADTRLFRREYSAWWIQRSTPRVF